MKTPQQEELLRRRDILVATLAVASTGLLCWVEGCAPAEPPFAAKPAQAPKAIYCFDGVGHIRGSKPFILGGTCCCTPTQSILDQYHSDGVATDITPAELVKTYTDHGIRTALDHHNCNNLCNWGPHVVKGGKCMVPPTPGTVNYEEIRYAIRYVPAKA
jgi:hypothetical protein